MLRLSCSTAFALLICVGAGAARAQVVVPNGSFEEGDASPTSWTLSRPPGELVSPGSDGQRAVSVTGDGQSDNAWLSEPLQLEPNAAYRLRFQVRQLQGTGGSAVSGPVFCNRDLGSLGAGWAAVESFFVTPRQLSDDIASLRFGQWQLNGGVAFDDVHVERVIPVYQTQGDLQLGEGERLEGNRYTFEAPLQQASANQSRPLAWHQCSFNSNRWVLSDSASVTYRQHVGRQQTKALVQATVGWYLRGELVVSASRDGKDWQIIGTLGKEGSVACELPPAILPADEIWVRFTVRAAAGETQPPSLQLHGYHYEALVDGPATDILGATRFVAVLESDPQLRVLVTHIGDAIPGGNNQVTLRLQNHADKPLRLAARVDARRPAAIDGAFAATVDRSPPPVEIVVPAGASGDQTVQVPYTLDGVGMHRLAIQISGDARFTAETTIDVPALHAAHYGQTLPASNAAVGLWWCSSGWKVSSQRPVPSAGSLPAAVRIAAAANEAEAAQLVVRPTKSLTGFTATTGELTGPAGAKIDRQRVDILRVRYVQVTQPTDASSTVGLWPDPLPPFTGPLTLEADRNLPLWIRVRVPESQPRGTYHGTITLQADDYRAEIPLQVDVFGFALPDQMKCQTAFGFDTDQVWRYHGLKTEDNQRLVLDKYHQCLADHHISPYEPAPLDPIRVTWKNLPAWAGGEVDPKEAHAGSASLRLADQSATANVSAEYQPQIPVGGQGVKLSFWYRTHQPGQRTLVTLSHQDANGHWMSGRNNDLSIEGDGTWQHFERTIDKFPSGAKSISVTLRATDWREDGSLTGTVWFDDVSLIDVASGTERIAGGGFESNEQPIPEPVFDFAAWDRAMRRAIDVYHFNSFRLNIPGLGGGTFHQRYEPELLGFAEHTPQYEGAMRAFLGTLQAHLREQGWLEEAFVYWFDEPDPKDYAFVNNGFAKLKKWAPDVRRMLTEQVEPDLVGGPNIWCPLTPSFDKQVAQQRCLAGDAFWWYVCTGPKAPYCTLFIDHPGTEMRVWLWQTWQRKISGVLVWDTNYWTSSSAYPDPAQPQNPYEDPMGWVSGYSTPDGVRQAWGNGDGRFLYPPESAADGRPAAPVLEGPVDSIRLEMLRDGLEDYEYFAILQRLLEAHREKLTAQQLAEYTALLEVPPAITSDLTTFTTDPAPLEQHREALARAIEQLSQ
jgi:hypothetical protein